MTIRHVAARAGVSPATVSRVFSHPDAVTLEPVVACSRQPTT